MIKEKTSSSRPAHGLAVPVEVIERRIFLFRDQKVMLDSDLAELYGVTTKRLNEQVKRNRDRFPPDFMFRLTLEEGKAVMASRSQIATLKKGQNIKYAPYVFTEHGAVMAANVLNSPTAVKMSIVVVRAFVKLREVMATHKELAEEIRTLKTQAQKHGQAIIYIIEEIKKLKTAPKSKSKPIGFISEHEKK